MNKVWLALEHDCDLDTITVFSEKQIADSWALHRLAEHLREYEGKPNQTIREDMSAYSIGSHAAKWNIFITSAPIHTSDNLESQAYNPILREEI